jgi:hypothetical protein
VLAPAISAHLPLSLIAQSALVQPRRHYCLAERRFAVRCPGCRRTSLDAASTLAAKRATTTIPIVMVTSSDAVTTGIVASLARPGGNITRSTFMGPELHAKHLELLKEALPDLKRVARLVNPTNTAVAAIYKDTERAAVSLKIEHSDLEARNSAISPPSSRRR